jgi:dipeptidyl aminopeptidase/acylaminoacyl peptidase
VNWPVTIRPKAKADLRLAHDWYEDQCPGLGDEFLAAHAEALPRVWRARSQTQTSLNRMKVFCFAFALIACAANSVRGAGPVFRSHISPHWFAGPDGVTNRFWYRLNLPGGKTEFVTVNAETGARQTASRRDGADDDSLPVLRAPHPSRDSAVETEVTFENRLGEMVRLFWVDPGGRHVAYGSLRAGETCAQHTFAGHVWLVTSANSNSVAVFEAEETPGVAIIDGRRSDRPRDEKLHRAAPARDENSPDGKWGVLVRDHNLFLRVLAAQNETQLTSDGSAANSYARNEEINRAIEMEYDRRDPEMPAPEVFWSPDSKHFVAFSFKPGAQRRVYLIESSPEDQLQPKLDSYPYLKPGDDVPIHRPHLFDVETKKEIPVSDTLFANPWSIDDVRWDADSSRFTFLYNQRGHQVLRVVAVDALTGAAKPIMDETNSTFIDYSGKFFCEHLDDTGEIIWMSERDGWNHLYLYDTKTGAVKNQITKGEWVVHGVDFVDRVNRQIWFQAGGIVPGQDPYFIHFCRVNFDGTGLRVLTDGNGTHMAQFSPDRKYLIDTWSRVDALPVTELRGSDGKLICKLETAEVDGKPQLPEPFVAKGRDGVTDIYGVVWHPKNIDPRKKYPVVENIYAGPQDSFTPKNFHASYQQQRLADRGFFVVQMDGMGTANRSKKFHDVCWKNLRDAGFPDRILWIHAAAKKFPAMDLSRVGIYGASAGGQDALRGLLDHGDFYKAGVADSGCYDNRMDKIWWNEQWMGWPVDESYERSSCVVDAHKLRGKLLLMAGELDKNVDPASTMQMVNALVKTNKNFELLVMPGQGHGVLSTPYGWRRLEDFFERNLGGVK